MSDLALPTSIVFRCRVCAREVPCAARPPTQCPGCRSIGTCFVAVPASDVRPIVDAPAKRKPQPSVSWGLPAFGAAAMVDAEPEPAAVPVRASEIVPTQVERHLTGIAPLDRALGKARLSARGAALGSCNTLSGPPGAGKSTLCFQALAGHALAGLPCVYITGEQQPEDLVLRAHEMGIPQEALDGIHMVWCEDFDQAIGHIDDLAATAFVVDSLQMMTSRNATGRRRAPAQIDYGSKLFFQRASGLGQFKDRPPCVGYQICHADEDGDMAGPTAARHNASGLYLLEHFDPTTGATLAPKDGLGFIRMRVEKNRFGDTQGYASNDERGVLRRLEFVWKQPEGMLVAVRGSGDYERRPA